MATNTGDNLTNHERKDTRDNCVNESGIKDGELKWYIPRVVSSFHVRLAGLL